MLNLPNCREFQNFVFVHIFQFDNKFVFSDENQVVNVPHMSIFGTCTQNIPNQKNLREKIDKNPWAFLVSKITFYGNYDPYKLCFLFILY